MSQQVIDLLLINTSTLKTRSFLAGDSQRFTSLVRHNIRMLERHFAFGHDCEKMMSAIRTFHGFGPARLSLAAILLLLIVAAVVNGQTSPRPTATPPPNPSSPLSNDHTREDDASNDYGSPENEMRAKMILKEEKKRYDENIGREREG